jgi:hypothetical protein
MYLLNWRADWRRDRSRHAVFFGNQRLAIEPQAPLGNSKVREALIASGSFLRRNTLAAIISQNLAKTEVLLPFVLPLTVSFNRVAPQGCTTFQHNRYARNDSCCL